MLATPCLFTTFFEILSETEGSERKICFSFHDLCQNITVRQCLQLFSLPDDIVDRIVGSGTAPDFGSGGELAVIATAIKNSTTRLSTLRRCSVSTFTFETTITHI